MKTPTELVNDIDDILKEIWNQLDNPELLSRSILKLAVLNGGLGNVLADAQNDANKAKIDYGYKVDKAKITYVDADNSATVAETKAKLDNIVFLREANDLAHNAYVLKLKREDTDKAIDAARSRLSLIKQDLRQ